MLTPTVSPKPGSQTVSVVRRVEGVFHEAEDRLALEEPLEIQLAYENSHLPPHTLSVTMRTPGQDRELAVGFLFAEGILRGKEDLAEVPATPSDDGTSILIRVKPHVFFNVEHTDRHSYTHSGCGVCGKTSLEALDIPREISLPRDGLRVSPDVIAQLSEKALAAQDLFSQTGGLHAAALFDDQARLICLREDIGRHNALDKVIGHQVLAGTPPLHDRILFVSGRASFELVQKALMAEIPVMAAVGPPSSLAFALAECHGLTLLGFVREDRFNIYTGSWRVKGMV